MSYVRLDDQFPRHRKVLAAGPSSDPVWFFTCAIAYSSSQLTDGHITRAALPLIGLFRNPRRLAERCEQLGLFDPDPNGDGWWVHDYLDYNQSAEQVRHAREAAAERKRRERGRQSGQGLHADESPINGRARLHEATEEWRLEPVLSHAESRRESQRDGVRDSQRPSRVTLARARTPTPTPTPTPDPTPKKSKGMPADRLEPGDLAALWNAHMAGTFPAVKAFTGTRGRHAAARLREHPDADFWLAVFDRMKRSHFLQHGRPDRPWKADFDWLLKPDSAARVLEGKYDDRQAPTATSGRIIPDADETARLFRARLRQDTADPPISLAEARRRGLVPSFDRRSGTVAESPTGSSGATATDGADLVEDTAE